MIFTSSFPSAGLVCGLLFSLLSLPGASHAATPAQERGDIQKMRGETLANLYRAHPAARSHIQQAAGYAV
jgi:hypothetical protein